MKKMVLALTLMVVAQSTFALEASSKTTASIRSEERRVGKECRSRWSAKH